MQYLICDFCGMREHVDHIKTVQIDPIVNRGKSKCRRCRLRTEVQPYWDRLVEAEIIVRGAPDDYDALQALREARIAFVVANRPRIKEKAHEPQAGSESPTEQRREHA